MVSSAHPIATRAGIEILAMRGNAFDATVAVAAALNVVEPMMSGVGGYGTILLHSAEEEKSWFLNSSAHIPQAVDSDVFRAPTPDFEANRRGPKAISTPANARAWEAMHQKYGSLDWERLFQPAIQTAREGFLIDQRTAGLIERAWDDFPEQAKAIYGREGRPRRAGERLVQSALSDSLEIISRQGARALHGGELGRRIAADLKKANSFLTLADLERAQAEWWEPIEIEYRDYRVVTASPPSTAFPSLLRLGLMSRFDLAALGHNSAEYLHLFSEATKHAFWARLAYAGDPEINPPPLQRLLSPEYWSEEAGKFESERAKPFVPPGPVGDMGDNTTHFVVADRFGNVVSATQTPGNSFGSRLMPGGTGIWLNNSLAYCTFEPKGNPMDAHAGRRKLSGDCPTFLIRDDRVVAALGTPGGHTIGQTVPQMVMNLVDFRMDIRDALAAPRISFVEPDSIAVESGISASVRAELERRGHKVQEVRVLGNAHGLQIEYDEAGRPILFRGASDPRGPGLAAGPP